MSGYDDLGVFYSGNFASEDQQTDEERVNLVSIKRGFKDFLRQYHEGNFLYKYRDELKQHYNLGQYWLEINLQHLSSFDETLADKLNKNPAEYLPLFEDAAKDVADEITRPRPEGEEEIQDIQILLKSEANPIGFRDLKSDIVSKLVQIPGIIISASGIRAKATRIALQCRGCKTVLPNIAVKPGLEGYMLPRKCNTDQAGRPPCPMDPFFVIPDKCQCSDSQILKLQEAPEFVPNGEMPRHLQLYCDRYLCDRVVPGNRVMLMGIYSIKKISSKKLANDRIGSVGTRVPYIRVVGIHVETDGPGRSMMAMVTSAEEEAFIRFANQPDVFDRVVKSIAPSIYGFTDIKKAVSCLLFSGSRKRLPDGLTRRGDINLLLLGDPGTAKSQLLKFVEKVSPIGVYTSGKGSSAAGLTASVNRDPNTRAFVMEGGAMVLADGGVVCIDEFDKMREDDRVAIHEAMEQQTISIAKAGITTTLNSRCAVLAAANSVFGRWDDSKGDENIDFMPTILSRFDMIFVVKDEHDQTRDTILAKHIMNVHTMGKEQEEQSVVQGELDINFLKKYIAYCKLKCGPRLTESAGEKLKSRYVEMRNTARQEEQGRDKRLSIPITIRQLEAIIRISESLAKMQMLPFVTDSHVDEALRLFKVSTMDSATSGTLSGAEGFTTTEDIELLNKVERQIKRRFAIGSQVSEQNIVRDFVEKQKYPEKLVYKVLHFMLRRGEIQHRVQRKMLYRLK